MFIDLKNNEKQKLSLLFWNTELTPDDDMLLLFLWRLKAVIISCFGPDVLLNDSSFCSDVPHNVTSSGPWTLATVQMTRCRALNGPILFQRLVAMVIGVSHHFRPGHAPTPPMFPFVRAALVFRWNQLHARTESFKWRLQIASNSRKRQRLLNEKEMQQILKFKKLQPTIV